MSLQSATARVAAIQARIGALPGRARGQAEFQGVLNDVQRLTGVSPQDAAPVASNLAAETYQAASLGADQNDFVARLGYSGTATLGSMISGDQDLEQLLSLLGVQPGVAASQNSGAVSTQVETLRTSAPVLEGFAIGSGYGNRIHPITKTEQFHPGVDIGAPQGTPIATFADGVVSFAGPKGGYGNMVVVDHGGGVETRYAHQAEVAVQAGDEILAGQTLGYVGSTGNSTGPHLHFEMRESGDTVDPTPYLAATGMSVKGKH
ncbi:MAG: M23 family metallopeptidase [Acidimicrobiales bacterium]